MVIVKRNNEIDSAKRWGEKIVRLDWSSRRLQTDAVDAGEGRYLSTLGLRLVYVTFSFYTSQKLLCRRCRRRAAFFLHEAGWETCRGLELTVESSAPFESDDQPISFSTHIDLRMIFGHVIGSFVIVGTLLICSPPPSRILKDSAWPLSFKIATFCSLICTLHACEP